MTKPEDLPYSIAGRELISETSEMRIQILTLDPGEEISWHYHSKVADTIICLEGPMTVEIRPASGTKDIHPGETFSIIPKKAHRVIGKDDGGCRFFIVQAIGAPDFIPI